MITAGVFLASCSSTQNTKPAQVSKSSVPGYWQQHVDYSMDVDMNVENFNYTGKQKLVYTNNSPCVSYLGHVIQALQLEYILI